MIGNHNGTMVAPMAILLTIAIGASACMCALLAADVMNRADKVNVAQQDVSAAVAEEVQRPIPIEIAIKGAGMGAGAAVTADAPGASINKVVALAGEAKPAEPIRPVFIANGDKAVSLEPPEESFAEAEGLRGSEQS